MSKDPGRSPPLNTTQPGTTVIDTPRARHDDTQRTQRDPNPFGLPDTDLRIVANTPPPLARPVVIVPRPAPPELPPGTTVLLPSRQLEAVKEPPMPAPRPSLVSEQGAAPRASYDDLDLAPRSRSWLAERFRPVQLLSQGGMGRVLLVQEVLSGRFVALKLMQEAALHHEPLVQQFIREAVITARLQHTHIIPVYDLGFLTNRQLYYTMRYIDGTPLDRAAAVLPVPERLRLLRGAVLAVRHAHQQSLWHRDLKPDNILVTEAGEVFVIDWGLVSIQPGQSYQLNLPRIVIENTSYDVPENLDKFLCETSRAVTALGGDEQRLLGTPAYMAPEQVRMESARMGTCSDIWALGIILFKLLTGRHPLLIGQNDEPAAILHRVMTQPLPDPRDLTPAMPGQLAALTARMLCRDPARRAGADEVLEEITRYLRGEAQVTLVPAVPGRAGAGTGAQQEIQVLRERCERYEKKNTLLTELCQTSIFSRARRRALWAQLARL